MFCKGIEQVSLRLVSSVTQGMNRYEKQEKEKKAVSSLF